MMLTSVPSHPHHCHHHQQQQHRKLLYTTSTGATSTTGATAARVTTWTIGATSARSPLSADSKTVSSTSRRLLQNAGTGAISSTTTSSSTALYMGLFDNMLSNFLKDRENDFIKLEDSDTPDELLMKANDDGSQSRHPLPPILICYNVPKGVTNDEINDMLSDGAPNTYQLGIIIKRIATTSTNDSDSDDSDSLLNQSLLSAIQSIGQQGQQDDSSEVNEEEEPQPASRVGEVSLPSSVPLSSSSSSSTDGAADANAASANIPVLLYCNFYNNNEMITSYNIIGKEVYDETFGVANTACAKVVTNALSKPLQQVLNEIIGDHNDVINQN